MKKYLTRDMYKRIIMTVCGVMIAGFSVGMFDFSDLGVDPFQVLVHGIWLNINITFGTLYTIVNIIMLIGVFIIDKKKIGLGTLINIFLTGYAADFSLHIWETLIPSPTLAIKFCFLLMGIVIMCFASALYFTADLGVSTYDAVALVLAEKQKKVKFQYCRISTDLICVIIGFLLGANVSAGYTHIGTIITAFFMGPLIAFFNRTVAIPLRYGKKGKAE